MSTRICAPSSWRTSIPTPGSVSTGHGSMEPTSKSTIRPISRHIPSRHQQRQRCIASRHEQEPGGNNGKTEKGTSAHRSVGTVYEALLQNMLKREDCKRVGELLDTRSLSS